MNLWEERAAAFALGLLCGWLFGGAYMFWALDGGEYRRRK